jgi:uncharacterized protein
VSIKKPRLRAVAVGLAKLSLVLFFALNGIAYMHAYRFTHFSSSKQRNVRGESGLSLRDKVRLAIAGVDLPKPVDSTLPPFQYEVLRLPNAAKNECWLGKVDNAFGTVVLCHGYGGSKSGMIGKAIEFQKQGYNTLLMDFSGCASSSTNVCTVGYNESEEVRAAVAYLRARCYNNIHCCGTSMGAVAIIKAEHDSSLQCASLILECPFGSLKQTVYNRFEMQGAPKLPLAPLLVFWGGAQHGFNAFNFVPSNYAKDIRCNTLLICGTKDPKVTAAETSSIFSNLQGKKKLVWLQGAGHAYYLNTHASEWRCAVQEHLAISSQ